jgi:pyridoxamine 5'-phosphate oxidase
MEHPAVLKISDFPHSGDPFALFALWMKEAAAKEPRDPDACALATVDAGGLPDVRMVLLKRFDERGFVFFTNTESTKGQELEGNLKAALVLHWKSLNRQIRIRGTVERIAATESDDYFATRPRGAQIGAWASQQSRPLDSRETLQAENERFEKKYPGEVPRPPHWAGYRIVPLTIEFWMDQPFRLHDRLVFSRAKPGAEWKQERLYP